LVVHRCFEELQKNHGSVAVVCNEDQYDHVIESIKAGGFTADERKRLALEVFRTTAEYDLTIASWLGYDDQLSA
jgi:phosphoribosylaminoimidazolecarboxamide formyltransferase/IMP cyclohydrolase